MPNFQKLVIIFISGVAVLIVSLAAILFYGFTREYIDQTDGLLTREQALAEHCPIELPTSAHHVQYSWLAGGLQDGEQYVRFEAPVSDCYKTAKEHFAKDSDTMQQSDSDLPPICTNKSPWPAKKRASSHQMV